MHDKIKLECTGAGFADALPGSYEIRPVYRWQTIPGAGDRFSELDDNSQEWEYLAEIVGYDILS